MATANAASDCSDTEPENGADQQSASSEIMSLDELTNELMNVNRRFEVLAMHLAYNKAEHKEIIALKDEKIEKLERELEQKTSTEPEMIDENKILTNRIYYLKSTLTKLEEENQRLSSIAVHKDEEIKNLRENMEKLHRELYLTEARLSVKTEEVRLHKEDTYRLERKLDENNHFLAENVKHIKEMQRGQKNVEHEMKEIKNLLARKIDEGREISGSSPPKASQSAHEINFGSSTVSGPGNRGTSRPSHNVKLPPIFDRTTQK